MPGLFHLACVFWVHPCYSTYQNFILFFLKAGADPIVGHTTFHLPTHQLTDLGVVCTLEMMLLKLLRAAFVHLRVQTLASSSFL